MGRLNFGIPQTNKKIENLHTICFAMAFIETKLNRKITMLSLNCRPSLFFRDIVEYFCFNFLGYETEKYIDKILMTIRRNLKYSTQYFMTLRFTLLFRDLVLIKIRVSEIRRIFFFLFPVHVTPLLDHLMI